MTLHKVLCADRDQIHHHASVHFVDTKGFVNLKNVLSLVPLLAAIKDKCVKL